MRVASNAETPQEQPGLKAMHSLDDRPTRQSDDVASLLDGITIKKNHAGGLTRVTGWWFLEVGMMTFIDIPNIWENMFQTTNEVIISSY